MIGGMRFLLVLLFAFFATDAQADVTGKANVIDGDTIRIAGERIRLHGIDAPEMDQVCHTTRGRPYECGVVAKKALSDLLRGRTVKGERWFCSEAEARAAGWRRSKR